MLCFASVCPGACLLQPLFFLIHILFFLSPSLFRRCILFPILLNCLFLKLFLQIQSHSSSARLCISPLMLAPYVIFAGLPVFLWLFLGKSEILTDVKWGYAHKAPRRMTGTVWGISKCDTCWLKTSPYCLLVLTVGVAVSGPFLSPPCPLGAPAERGPSPRSHPRTGFASSPSGRSEAWFSGRCFPLLRPVARSRRSPICSGCRAESHAGPGPRVGLPPRREGAPCRLQPLLGKLDFGGFLSSLWNQ